MNIYREQESIKFPMWGRKKEIPQYCDKCIAAICNVGVGDKIIHNVGGWVGGKKVSGCFPPPRHLPNIFKMRLPLHEHHLEKKSGLSRQVNTGAGGLQHRFNSQVKQTLQSSCMVGHQPQKDQVFYFKGWLI